MEAKSDRAESMCSLQHRHSCDSTLPPQGSLQGQGQSSSVSHRGCPQPGSPAQPWGSCMPDPLLCGDTGTAASAAWQGRAGPCSLHPFLHHTSQQNFLGMAQTTSPGCQKSIPDMSLAVLVNTTPCLHTWPGQCHTCSVPARVDSLRAVTAVCAHLFHAASCRIHESPFCWLASSFCNGFVKH